jgi:hypothetical protein
LLTIPVTDASGKISFSKLKLVKSYLRSTLGDEKPTSLKILSIENKIAQKLDFSEIIKNFAKSKDLRQVKSLSTFRIIFLMLKLYKLVTN